MRSRARSAARRSSSRPSAAGPELAAERAAKLARLRVFLDAHRLDAVVLATRAGFAWLTGGGDAHVLGATERAVATLVVARRAAHLVTTAIELPRLAAEEPLAGFTIEALPWAAADVPRAVRRLVRRRRIVSDDPASGFPSRADDLAALRVPLLPPEVDRYRALGRDAARAVETVARDLRPGVTEHAVAAALAAHLLTAGIEPHVLLVAGDDRIDRFRHPIPTAQPIRGRAMLVACGRRHGLVANLTRLVHFGPVPAVLARRHRAVVGVEGALWKATRPGAKWGDALSAGLAAYRRAGFADEWRLHHQGGPTGYASREFLATPVEKRRIALHQAVAWNPSITGTKSEDTTLVTPDGLEVLTAASADWPRVTVEVGGEPFARPGILVR